MNSFHFLIMVKNTNSKIPLVGFHYKHELPQEDEERYGELFKNLDIDGKGKIDIHDLSAALKESGLDYKYAQVFITHSQLSIPRGGLAMCVEKVENSTWAVYILDRFTKYVHNIYRFDQFYLKKM